ncbi:MAG: hypothetical protein AAGF88_09680 [Pseudomonadota bacterium]
MAEELDPNFFPATTLSTMVRNIGKSVAEASVELAKAQVDAIKDYPKELADVGLTPVIYHMQEVDVELKVVFEVSTQKSERERGAVAAFFLGPAVTQTDTFDVSGASTMQMKFAPGPVETPPVDPDES